MKRKSIFSPITFTRLRRDEFSYLVKQVIKVLRHYEPERLHLTFAFGELQLAYAQLDLLNLPNKKHPISVKVLELREERVYIIQAILMQIKTMEKTSKVLAIPQLELLRPIAHEYLRPILYRNSNEQTTGIGKLFIALDSDAELQALLERLDLTALFEELRRVNQAYFSTGVDRIHTTERNIVTTAEARARGEKALRNLMKTIDVSQLQHTEIDYSDLISKMNELFTTYAAQVKARTTISKKNKAKKKNAADSQATTDE